MLFYKNPLLFNNNNPITLELGCGKGEYTVGLARKYPDRNFVGVDIKGHRFWRGAKTAKEESLPNVAFLRTRIEFIDKYFEAEEVSEIWLTFSDPQPKDEKGTKRITSSVYIERYKKILKPGGLLRFKTDNTDLFEYTLEEVLPHQQIKDFEFTILAVDTRKIKKVKVHLNGGEKDSTSPFTD